MLNPKIDSNISLQLKSWEHKRRTDSDTDIRGYGGLGGTPSSVLPSAEHPLWDGWISRLLKTEWRGRAKVNTHLKDAPERSLCHKTEHPAGASLQPCWGHSRTLHHNHRLWVPAHHLPSLASPINPPPPPAPKPHSAFSVFLHFSIFTLLHSLLLSLSFSKTVSLSQQHFHGSLPLRWWTDVLACLDVHKAFIFSLPCFYFSPLFLSPFFLSYNRLEDSMHGFLYVCVSARLLMNFHV